MVNGTCWLQPQRVMRFKVGDFPADDVWMGPHPVATIEATGRRDTRIAAKPGAVRYGVVGIIIECVDKTCTVVGGDFSLSCRSIDDAMGTIEKMASPVVWRETTPGFWVARAA